MYGIRHAWAKKVAKKIEFMTKEFGIFCYNWKRGIKKGSTKVEPLILV